MDVILLCVCVRAAGCHGNMAKLITLSGSSACCVSFSPRAPSCLSFYFLAGLCSLAVYSAACYRTFSQTRALTIPRPLHAFCLSRGTVHNGVYKGTQLFWSHSSRKSMEEGFLFSEEGGSRGENSENSDIFQVNSFQLENFMLLSPIQWINWKHCMQIKDAVK